MDEEIKRWTAKRKTALVLEIVQGKTSVSEASWWPGGCIAASSSGRTTGGQDAADLE